jgi:hypothetical protein
MDDWHLVATISAASLLAPVRVTHYFALRAPDYLCVHFDLLTPPTRLFLFARNLGTVLPMASVQALLHDVEQLPEVTVCETFGMTMPFDTRLLELPRAVYMGVDTLGKTPCNTTWPLSNYLLFDNTIARYKRIFQEHMSLLDEALLNIQGRRIAPSSPALLTDEAMLNIQGRSIAPASLLATLAKTSAADVIWDEAAMPDIKRRTFLEDILDQLCIKPRPTLDMAGTPSCMRCGINRAAMLVHHLDTKADDCLTLCANCHALFATEVGTERCPQCGEFAREHENTDA